MSDENEQVRGFGHDNTELVNSGDEAEYDAAQASKLKDLDKGDNQALPCLPHAHHRVDQMVK